MLKTKQGQIVVHENVSTDYQKVRQFHIKRNSNLNKWPCVTFNDL